MHSGEALLDLFDGRSGHVLVPLRKPEVNRPEPKYSDRSNRSSTLNRRIHRTRAVS
jgi:hypothetical protein